MSLPSSDRRLCRTFLVAAFALAGCASTTGDIARDGAPASTARHDATATLVAAERAFARMAEERGVRAAFIANFADDGVAFEPQPVIVRQAWPTRPAAPDPLASKLAWHPVLAGVAASGDFGYTTGPWTLTQRDPAAPTLHGVYFSVWRRTGDGPWRVEIDAGIATREPVDAAAMGPAPALAAAPGGREPAALGEDLRRREAALNGADRRGLAAAGYAPVLAPDARLHRDGLAPISGAAAVQAELAASGPARFCLDPLAAGAARSGDLAWTYGRVAADCAAGARPVAYYVHLWVCAVADGCRIAQVIWMPAAGG